MATRIAVSLYVEYRGVKPSREYTNRDTGERRTAPPLLKFEYDKGDGDVDVIEVSGSAFDRMTPPVDYTKFSKGEKFTLSGVAVLQDRGSEWTSYLSIESCRPSGSAKAGG